MSREKKQNDSQYSYLLHLKWKFIETKVAAMKLHYFNHKLENKLILTSK